MQMSRTDSISARNVFDLMVRRLDGLILSFVVAITVNAMFPGLLSIPAQAATAETGAEIAACATGHLFVPGPIVNGHHRQPTQAEIETRTQELSASKVNGGSC
jgi:hypothetical protein